MGKNLFAGIFRKKEKRSLNASQEFIRAVGMGSGVNENTAMNCAAIWACIRLIAGTISTLPIQIYRQTENGRDKAREHPSYTMLHTRPNPYIPAANFWEYMIQQTLLWGNAYAFLSFRDGRVAEIYPLKTSAMRIGGDWGQAPVYKYTSSEGEKEIPAYQILHLTGITEDGIRGISPIQRARQSIGIAISAESFSDRFYKRGVMSSGVLTHPGKLTTAKDGSVVANRIREDFRERYQGMDQMGDVIIIEEGMTYKELTMPLADAQFIETRKFQVIEICRWYGVTPHMIHELDRATFSNIEHQGIEFVQYCLRPWLVRIEQALNWSIFPEFERSEYYVEFNVDGLLRGDSKTRAETLHMMRNDGVLNGDEWRGLENMNPMPDGTGKVYLINGNMVPVATAGQNGGKQ